MILIMWNTLACVRQLDHTIFPHLISFQGWTRPGHSVSSHRMNAPVPSLFEGTSSPHWVWGGTGKLQPPLEWESGVWGWKTKAAKAGDIRRRKTEQRENPWVMHTNAHRLGKSSWAWHWGVVCQGPGRNWWGMKFWQECITTQKLRMSRWVPYSLNKLRTSPDWIPSFSYKTLISDTCWKGGTVGCSQPSFLECVRNNFRIYYTFS